MLKRQLQSIIGHLHHASKVVKPGRPFIRRLIDLASSRPHPESWIRLNTDFRSDIQWWVTSCSSCRRTLRMPSRSAAPILPASVFAVRHFTDAESDLDRQKIASENSASHSFCRQQGLTITSAGPRNTTQPALALLRTIRPHRNATYTHKHNTQRYALI